MNEEFSFVLSFLAGAFLAKNWGRIKKFFPKVSVSELSVYMPFIGAESETHTRSSSAK